MFIKVVRPEIFDDNKPSWLQLSSTLQQPTQYSLRMLTNDDPIVTHQDFGESFGEAFVLVAEGRLLVSVGDQVLGVWIKEPVKLLPGNQAKVFKFWTR